MLITPKQAVQLLKNGQVVALPTETVYGLAASVSFPEAIDQIFSLKSRPRHNPLIIHIHETAQLFEYIATIPEKLKELTHQFWPGPLTLILPIDHKMFPECVTAGLKTAAFRFPKHELTRLILKETGPLVMPSANLSGKPSSTCPHHVETDFGVNFPILDGGACNHGVESTILAFCDGRWEIARLGAISAEQLSPVLGYIPEYNLGKKRERPLCPGQLYRHYAPEAKLLLTKDPESYQGIVIGFTDRAYPCAKKVLSLSVSKHPEKALENLYSVLRQLDEESIKEAAIDINFPQKGLWLTLHERLQKASDYCHKIE